MTPTTNFEDSYLPHEGMVWFNLHMNLVTWVMVKKWLNSLDHVGLICNEIIVVVKYSFFKFNRKIINVVLKQCVVCPIKCH